jgi:uncharacterized RDD family membrane protein YckC
MARHSDRPPPRKETGPGGDDVPPSGEEARDPRRATSLPLVWLIIGVVLIGVFAVWMGARPPFHRPGPAPSAADAARLAPSPSKATPR